MGTRGLLGFIVKGKKKGSYNHWDSYPTGLGLVIIKFIMSLSEEDIEKMAAQLEDIEWFDTESIPSKLLQERYSSAGLSRTHSDYAIIDTGSLDNWYNLLYNTQGGKALPFILDGTLAHMPDNTDFADDDLMCEWTYWMDFEARTLETMNGSGTVGKADFKDLSIEYAVRLENPNMTEKEVSERLERLR